MPLKKITAADFNTAIKKLTTSGASVWWKTLGETEDGTKLCFVMGWNDGYDEDEDGTMYQQDGYTLCTKIGYKPSNLMVMDYTDFNMPYDNKTGEVWDTDMSVGKGEVTDDDFDVKWYNDEAEAIWKKYGKPDRDGKTALDLMESKKKEGKQAESDYTKEAELAFRVTSDKIADYFYDGAYDIDPKIDTAVNYDSKDIHYESTDNGVVAEVTMTFEAVTKDVDKYASEFASLASAAVDDATSEVDNELAEYGQDLSSDYSFEDDETNGDKWTWKVRFIWKHTTTDESKKKESLADNVNLDFKVGDFKGTQKSVISKIKKVLDNKGIANEVVADGRCLEVTLDNDNVIIQTIEAGGYGSNKSASYVVLGKDSDNHRNHTDAYSIKDVMDYIQDAKGGKSESKKHTCSMQKKKESLAKKNERLFTLYDIHDKYPNFWKQGPWRTPQFWKEYEDYYSKAYPTMGIKITMKDNDSVDVTSNGKFIMNYSWKNGRHRATAEDGSGFKHPGFGFRDDLSMIYRGLTGKEMGPYVPVYTDESKKKESKKHTCSMQKKKESLAKKCEEYIPNVRERLWSFIDAGFITTEEIGDYLLRALSVDTLENVYEWLVQDEMIPSEETLADEHQLKFNNEGEFVSIETDETKEG